MGFVHLGHQYASISSLVSSHHHSTSFLPFLISLCALLLSRAFGISFDGSAARWLVHWWWSINQSNQFVVSLKSVSPIWPPCVPSAFCWTPASRDELNDATASCLPWRSLHRDLPDLRCYLHGHRRFSSPLFRGRPKALVRKKDCPAPFMQFDRQARAL